MRNDEGMAKIGHDVVRHNPSESPLQVVKVSEITKNKDYRSQILNTLQTSQRPLNITEISKVTKINYLTVRSILMELLLAGEVERFESGRCLFYRIKS